MADQFVGLQPDAAGKKCDTSELLVGAATVQRQRMVVADPTIAAALAVVKNADPDSGDYGLVVRQVGKLWVVGALAHDSPAGDYPVLSGGRASTAEPTPVSDDGDAAHLWVDRYGRAIVVALHPNPDGPIVPVALTSVTETVIVSAPGGTNRIHVTSMTVTNTATNVNDISIRQGTGAGNNRFRVALAALGGGFSMPLNPPWILPAATELRMALTSTPTSGSVFVCVHYFVAPSG